MTDPEPIPPPHMAVTVLAHVGQLVIACGGLWLAWLLFRGLWEQVK